MKWFFSAWIATGTLASIVSEVRALRVNPRAERYAVLILCSALNIAVVAWMVTR